MADAKTQAQWFPNASNGIALSLQQVFQRVLSYVYLNQRNIATNSTQIAALQAAQPSGIFPAHFNSLGTAGTIAYDTIGNIYVCYAPNTWVRVGVSGTSTSF